MKRHLALSTLAAAVAALAPSPALAGTSSAREVTPTCQFTSFTAPSSMQTVTAVVGSATAQPPNEAAATWIRCVLRNRFTNAVIYDRQVARAGSQATLTDAVPHVAASLMVCTQGGVLWSDAEVTVTSLDCL